MNHQNPTLKKAMIDALVKSLGVVTTAAKIAGIDRSTHYDWLNNDDEYKAAVESIEDIAIDFAESKLHSQIEKGDTTATIFYLKTKGKKRGYIEKQEYGMTDKNGEDVIQIIQIPYNGRELPSSN
jgi:hypothetical protein